MSLQTTAPLIHRSLASSLRQARHLAGQLQVGEIVVDLPYLRGEVWSMGQRRNLVWSWLLGLPVPTVILNDRCTAAWAAANGAEEPVWAVIDGRQRLESAVAWFSGPLDVPASWMGPQWVAATHDTADGPYVFFSELTEAARRLVSNRALLPVVEATAATAVQEAEIFALVNAGGVAQDPAAVERATRLGTD